jgi:hypothetical protein
MMDPICHSSIRAQLKSLIRLRLRLVFELESLERNGSPVRVHAAERRAQRNSDHQQPERVTGTTGSTDSSMIAGDSRHLPSENVLPLFRRSTIHLIVHIVPRDAIFCCMCNHAS